MVCDYITRSLNAVFGNNRMIYATFVKRIYLYDDKLVITFNHKDGAETITLNDIEAGLAEAENGSDLVSFAVPKTGNTIWCFPFLILRVGLERAALPEAR